MTLVSGAKILNRLTAGCDCHIQLVILKLHRRFSISNLHTFLLLPHFAVTVRVSLATPSAL